MIFSSIKGNQIFSTMYIFFAFFIYTFFDFYKVLYDVCRNEVSPAEMSDREDDPDEHEKEEFFLSRIESDFSLVWRDLFKRIMDSLIYHIKTLTDLEDFIQVREITFTHVFEALKQVLDDTPFCFTWVDTFSAWTSFFNIYEHFFKSKNESQNQDTCIIKAKFQRKITPLKRKLI